MTWFKRTALAVFWISSLLGLGLSAVPVYAASPSTNVAKQQECAAIGGTTSGGKCTTTGSPSLNTLIANIVNFLSLLIGVIAVIMIMVGGFKYVTSNGDSNSIASAKSTIIYAIVGVVVAALAQGIVRFVLVHVK